MELGERPIVVRGDRDRLLRGLFYFVEYLFRYVPENGATRIKASVAGRQAEMHISSQSRPPVARLGGRSIEHTPANWRWRARRSVRLAVTSNRSWETPHIMSG